MKKLPYLVFGACLLAAACQLPEPVTTGTPTAKTRPEAKPGQKVKPKPEKIKPKAWKYRNLKINSSVWALSISPESDMLRFVTRLSSAGVSGIKMRQMLLPQHREIFPLRFIVTNSTPDNLGPQFVCPGRRPCQMNNIPYVNSVIFDTKGAAYVLQSTGEIASGSSKPIRIIKFTKNIANQRAHNRTVIAGSPYGYNDGIGTAARFSVGIRNMAMSTDEKWLYLADWKNNKVRAVEIQSQVVSTLKLNYGTGTPSDSISRPTGIAVGKDNTVYVISNSGGVGTIMAIDVPLSLPTATPVTPATTPPTTSPVTTHTVSARRLALKDAEGSEYTLRNNPVWYLAVDGSDVLYTHIQGAGKRWIVKIQLNEAKTEGTVSEIAEIKGMGSRQIRGLEVNRDGTALYYGGTGSAHMYRYE